MSVPPWKRGLTYLGTRTVTFYLILYVISNLLIDYDRIRFGLKIRILNQSMPVSFQYLIELAEGQRKAGAEELMKYIRFYERVVVFFPDRADAFGLLGFCYYHLGLKDKALAAFFKAHQLKPNFFWYPYNLGILHMELKNIQQAAKYWQMALSADFQETLNFMNGSKVIYRSLFMHDPDYNRILPVRLRNAYQRCQQWVEIVKKIQKKESVLLATDDLRLQIF